MVALGPRGRLLVELGGCRGLRSCPAGTTGFRPCPAGPWGLRSCPAGPWGLRLASSLTRKSLLTLGLPEEASQQDIRAAYLRLSMESHPDTSNRHFDRPTEAAEVFQKVSKAYEHLKERNEEEKEQIEDDGDNGEKIDAFGKSKSGFKKSGNSLDSWFREVQEEGRRHRRKLREEEDREGEHFIKWNKKEKHFDEKNFEEFIGRGKWMGTEDSSLGRPYRPDGLLNKEMDKNYEKFEKSFIENLEKIPFFRPKKGLVVRRGKGRGGRGEGAPTPSLLVRLVMKVVGSKVTGMGGKVGAVVVWAPPRPPCWCGW